MQWIAPAEKDTATDTLEKRLWDAADQFRANSGLKPQEYSGPILGLIFLRFAEVRFLAQQAKLEKSVASLRRAHRVDDPMFYHADGILYLPPEARFDYLLNPVMDQKFRKNITPYSFRHTSATHWLDSAARQKRDVLPFIQRQLGHESLESTAIYVHVAIEPLRQMFRMYHPREISLKAIHKVPTPDEIISKLKDDLPSPEAPQPPFPPQES